MMVNVLREELLAQKIESELNRELTLLDPVTEVYNRRYARVILTREASRVRRYHSALALMLVDVTGFRHVNESIGHNGGDVVLRQIAQLLQNKIRNSDIIVRFGGDEFLMILPDAEKAGIERLEVRIKQSIIEWASTSGMSDFQLRFAVGVGFYRGEGRIDEILSLAENRMVEDRGKPDPEPEKLEVARQGA
jgi:diguanylate cyclase (GGDEF)-like protein